MYLTNYEEIENLNRLITNNEIESAIKSIPSKKTPGPDNFPVEFYQMFKELIPFILKLSPPLKKTEEEGILDTFYEATFTPVPKPEKDINNHNDSNNSKNYRPMSFMNTVVKILNKILAS
jgi:hypothetical protein